MGMGSGMGLGVNSPHWNASDVPPLRNRSNPTKRLHWETLKNAGETGVGGAMPNDLTTQRVAPRAGGPLWRPGEPQIPPPEFS
jgi:hypothetical protein